MNFRVYYKSDSPSEGKRRAIVYKRNRILRGKEQEMKGWERGKQNASMEGVE